MCFKLVLLAVYRQQRSDSSSCENELGIFLPVIYLVMNIVPKYGLYLPFVNQAVHSASNQEAHSAPNKDPELIYRILICL